MQSAQNHCLPSPYKNSEESTGQIKGAVERLHHFVDWIESLQLADALR